MNTKKFKDFNIKPILPPFTGEKISINSLLNVEIKVLNFKIEDSKKKPGTKLLTIHIEHNNIQRIIFTGATILMQLIEMIPKDDFPFKTTIVKQDQHLEFT